MADMGSLARMRRRVPGGIGVSALRARRTGRGQLRPRRSSSTGGAGGRAAVAPMFGVAALVVSFCAASVLGVSLVVVSGRGGTVGGVSGLVIG